MVDIRVRITTRDRAGNAATRDVIVVEQAPVSAVPTAGMNTHMLWDGPISYWTGSATPTARFFVHLDAIASLGVDMIRVDIGTNNLWPADTPEPPTNTPWFLRALRVLDEAHARGMQVFWCLRNSANWMTADAASTSNWFPDPAYYPRWQTFCQWFADQLTKHPACAGVENWNEPNLTQFTGYSDYDTRVTKYTQVLRYGYDGLKAGNPNGLVIFGGPSKNDWRFLDRCHSSTLNPSGHAGGHYDRLAVHPYQGNWKFPPESLDYTGVTSNTATNPGWEKERQAGGWLGVSKNASGQIVLDPAGYGVVPMMGWRGLTDFKVWSTECGHSADATNTALRSVTTEGVPGTWPTIQHKAGDYYVRQFEWLRVNAPQVTVHAPYVSYAPDGDPDDNGLRLLNADGSLTVMAQMIRDYLADHPQRRTP